MYSLTVFYNNLLMKVLEGEAWALWSSLNFASDLCLWEVYFESHFRVMVDKCHISKEDSSEAGVLISECRTMLSNNQSFHLDFVRRQANVVHSLARLHPILVFSFIIIFPNVGDLIMNEST